MTTEPAMSCPFHREPSAPGADDVLALPFHRRMVVQRGTEDGAPVLRLFYGDKEISFDEPELFAFGEGLAAHPRFRAGDAVAWSGGETWERLGPLLGELLAAGILSREAAQTDEDAGPEERSRPDPLAPSTCPEHRTFEDHDTIRDLCGRAIEPGHLETLVPIFRIAHASLDADDRQVGEANVFPPALRLDRPTEWATCLYPGTRHLSDRPMNLTALKAMRGHWRVMMAALARIRAAYLPRFPEIGPVWTIGQVERLAMTVLAVPTYALVRAGGPGLGGRLHPALSSLFRVTDGLRMATHQMMMVPVGEPALAPETPTDAAAILAYAERNYSFHSETGVCAGPKVLMEDFLATLLDGRADDAALPSEVENALADIGPATDYGLLGLQLHAATFVVWPAMTRAYEELAVALGAAAGAGMASLDEAARRFEDHVETMRRATYLGEESWRLDREAVYADMFASCARGLGGGAEPDLRARLALATDHPARVASRIERILRLRHATADDAVLSSLARTIGAFLCALQGSLRVASEIQSRINARLGRARPSRSPDAVDLDLFNRLQGARSRRLPWLLDELDAVFGLSIAVDASEISITSRPRNAGTARQDSAGILPAGSSPVPGNTAHRAMRRAS